MDATNATRQIAAMDEYTPSSRRVAVAAVDAYGQLSLHEIDILLKSHRSKYRA